MRWVLAIDLGTQGPKVGAISTTGEILSHSFAAVRTHRSDDGAATQLPADWWDAIKAQVRRLPAAIRDSPLAAVAITGQYGSSVPVDASGDAVGPCLLWADTRGAPYVAELFDAIDGDPGTTWRRVALGAPQASGCDPTGHEHYLRGAIPDVWSQTAALIEPVDYLGARLTGVIAATPASMIASFLIDPRRTEAPPRYEPELVALGRRDVTRLPHLRPTGSVLGDLRPSVCRELGLTSPAPVVGGVADLHTAYLGCGVSAPGRGHLVLSSTSWVGFAVRRAYHDADREVTTVAGVAPGHLLIENNQESAGIALDWAIDAFGVAATHGSVSRHATLAEMARSAPLAAGGVLFAPWLNGERTPLNHRELRGALIGLTAATSRTDIARAVFEGIAMNTRLLIDALTDITGYRLESLRLLGKCAALDPLCQIIADVTGRTFHRLAQPDLANLRGAARFALGTVDPSDLDDPGWAVVDRTFRPAEGAAPLYAELFDRFRALARSQASSADAAGSNPYLSRRP